jgi:hypothetical protein
MLCKRQLSHLASLEAYGHPRSGGSVWRQTINLFDVASDYETTDSREMLTFTVPQTFFASIQGRDPGPGKELSGSD